MLKRTKETKVASVNDGDGIGVSGHIVERVESTSNVCDAKNTAMRGIKNVGLGVDLRRRPWKRRRSRTTGA
jgi:hypothetical protein